MKEHLRSVGALVQDRDIPARAPKGAGAGFAVAGMAVTCTLLQNVEVLSAGRNFQKDAQGKPVLVQVVNLPVTPEHAEIMNLATEQRIQLVLRNPLDHEVVQTPGAPPAKPRNVIVEVFAGDKKSQSTFQNPASEPPQ